MIRSKRSLTILIQANTRTSTSDVAANRLCRAVRNHHIDGPWLSVLLLLELDTRHPFDRADSSNRLRLDIKTNGAKRRSTK